MPESAAARAAFRQILLRSVFVPLIVMTMFAVALIVQVREFASSMREVEHTDEVITTLHQLEKTFVELKASARGFIITGDESYLEPYHNGLAAVPRLISELRMLTGDRTVAQRHLVEITRLKQQWLEYAEQRIAARRANEPIDLSVYVRGNQLMGQIRAVFKAFIDEETALRTERHETTQRVAWWTVAGAGGVTVLIGVFLSLLSRGQLRWLSSTYESSLKRARELSEQLEHRVQERTAELQVANEQLNDVNKELEAFAYSVSHDLRAPMRHISGFANLLKMSTESKLSAEDLDHLEIIHRTAVLSGRMVDDLLAFSRIGRTQMRKDVVNVDALLATCLSELSPETRGRKIEWTIPPLPPAVGDAALLKLAFINLLGNAIKYTKPREVAHIELGSRPDEGGTTYFVKDDGVGFDMAYAHKLFGVFQRLHRAEDFEGTGIGLANVRRIIVRHGGRVWAEGVVGSGSTFFVFLPGGEAVPEVSAVTQDSTSEIAHHEPETNSSG